VRRLRFVIRATVSGWSWLVRVWHHVALAVAILAFVGIGAYTGFRLHHWWLLVIYLGGVFLLCFGDEAEKEGTSLRTDLEEARRSRAAKDMIAAGLEEASVIRSEYENTDDALRRIDEWIERTWPVGAYRVWSRTRCALGMRLNGVLLSALIDTSTGSGRF
jgi:hypothetical protein